MSNHYFGKLKVTHEVSGNQHQMIIEGHGSSGWVSTTLPLTYQSGDNQTHLVCQLLTDRLPKVFRLVCEDHHALEIMEIDQ